MEPELAELIEQGATIVTPNRRLAAELARHYAVAQRARGAAVWRTPDVLPFALWLTRGLQHAVRDDSRLQLLTPLQEQVLWQQALAAEADASPLIDIAAAAQQAREAHALECDWMLPASRDATLSDECSAYLRWRKRVLQRCRDQGWVDAAQAPDLLIERIVAGAATLERLVVPYGFDRLTPRQEALFAALRSRGTAVLPRAPGSRPAAATLRLCGTQRDEWAHVARSILEILQRNAHASIGVVVPNLLGVRQPLLSVFEHVFTPAGMPGGAAPAGAPYNVSAGLPLSSYPLVHAALIILRFAEGAVAWQEIGSLLRSPFLADAEREMSARAALDARLRAIGMLELDPAALLRTLQHAPVDAPHACRRLTARLAPWADGLRAQLGGRRLPSQWSGTVARVLAGLAWPGERSLDSEEYQTLQKWHEALADLARLDALLGRIDYRALRGQLSRQVSQLQFQPEAEARPVQILGVLESSGLAFDHLFVTGLNDDVWPVPARPNPFLPIVLQRARDLPHSSATWETGFARRMQALWCGAAPEVIFTCPTLEGDRALRPSPLLDRLASSKPPAQGYGYDRVIYAAGAVEQVLEGSAPVLAAGYEVAAGAALFADQAACPFRAFVLHRLGAKPLEEPVAGLDARERGKLLHAVLHRLWQRWRTQARLLQRSDGEIESDLIDATDAALDALASRRPDVMTDAFKTLERSRLRRLVLQLLPLERARAAFVVVEGEERHAVSFGGLRFNTRLDRVDELSDGRLVVLDYKSGDNDIDHWYGPRPHAPQLPLYAVTQTRPVAAAAFVSLRADEVAFKGLGDSDGLLSGVRPPHPLEAGAPDWDSLLASWRETLQRLAAEFLVGDARVDPKAYPQTCRYCALESVCRVQELLDQSARDDDE